MIPKTVDLCPTCGGWRKHRLRIDPPQPQCTCRFDRTGCGLPPVRDLMRRSQKPLPGHVVRIRVAGELKRYVIRFWDRNIAVTTCGRQLTWRMGEGFDDVER